MFKRKRITVLGVSLLAALGLMSVSAAGAQAGKWTIDGKALGTPGTPSPAGFKGSGGPVTLSSAGIVFNCSEMLNGGQLLTSGAGNAWITLAGCTVQDAEEACVIPGNTNLTASLKLNASGSELTFENVKGSLRVVSVEEACPFVVDGEQYFSLWGSIGAKVGSPAVQLGLNLTEAADSLYADFGQIEVKGSTSMSLTGAYSGKVLGTSS